MKRLAILLLLLTSASIGWADEIYIPVDVDPENPPNENRRRERPMMQWCTIDTDAHTVTTTLSVPVITYYVVDSETEAIVIASDSEEEFVSGVATLPEGVYTLRLITAESTFSGPLTIE